MKKSRYTLGQIQEILKQAESGVPISDLLHNHGVSSATFYVWRAKYGGMADSLVIRIKELEGANRRLKLLYAEEKVKTEVIKESLERRCSACRLWRKI